MREYNRKNTLTIIRVWNTQEKLGVLHARHIRFNDLPIGALHLLVAAGESIFSQPLYLRRLHETAVQHKEF